MSGPPLEAAEDALHRLANGWCP